MEAIDGALAVQSARRARAPVPLESMWRSEEDFRAALGKMGPIMLLVERFETFPLALQMQWLARFRSFRERRSEPFQRVLGQLASVLDFLEAAIASAAAAVLADPPPDLVSIDPKTSKTIPIPTQQKLVVEVVVTNTTESSLSGVSFSVHFADVNGKVMHPALQSHSLALKGGEQRIVRIEGRLEKNAPTLLPEPSFLVRTARRERRSS